jgi:hypothetical protein
VVRAILRSVERGAISLGGNRYAILDNMAVVRKITVGIPTDLLAHAQRVSGVGITEMVPTLDLVAGPTG